MNLQVPISHSLARTYLFVLAVKPRDMCCCRGKVCSKIFHRLHIYEPQGHFLGGTHGLVLFIQPYQLEAWRVAQVNIIALMQRLPGWLRSVQSLNVVILVAGGYPIGNLWSWNYCRILDLWRHTRPLLHFYKVGVYLGVVNWVFILVHWVELVYLVQRKVWIILKSKLIHVLK
jgi:hypothetical protein